MSIEEDIQNELLKLLSNPSQKVASTDEGITLLNKHITKFMEEHPKRMEDLEHAWDVYITTGHIPNQEERSSRWTPSITVFINYGGERNEPIKNKI